MLNMGFVDDVETILSTGTAGTAVQTLLFSATLPSWVKSITQRFLQKNHKMVDLVGTEKIKVGLLVLLENDAGFMLAVVAHKQVRPAWLTTLAACSAAASTLARMRACRADHAATACLQASCPCLAAHLCDGSCW